MSARTVDITLVMDPRFTGGTAQAFRTDVLACRARGMRVGIEFFEAGAFYLPTEAPNPTLLELADLDDIVLSPDRSAMTFLHNPQIFGRAQLGRAPRPPRLPKSERIFVVAHHPPFLGDGALAYDPLGTDQAIARLLPEPKTVEWLPVSGLVRAQLRSFQPFLALHAQDWPNSFDTGQWQPKREKLQPGLWTIGRHGRAHEDKWPDAAEDIAASLPARRDLHPRVLGAEAEFFASRGVDVSGWDILPFGTEDVAGFLDGLDLFSYFHSARWREAFGRTVAEAMMMGLRCVLDPALRPTFGPHALYCHPREVTQVVSRIREAPNGHRLAAMQAGAWCRAEFDIAQIGARLDALAAKPARRLSRGMRTASPLVTTRKLVGFRRRAAAREAAQS
ncbi:hypothetical protein AXZ77_2062 [Thioclava sp. ES.031]|uniref:glycosyltransferase family 1 protein n=1 Tax=Thioclava sp. ES.031 TaxID=1798203 RepID=UPI000BF38F98|nr:glycosyltransferase family 1 protein [Thioclava sp. ES.031]PFG63455.1 hypothetical protein AXZ77_2062 [Thioclava sp. ES.031]